MTRDEKYSNLKFAPHAQRTRVNAAGEVEVFASARRGWLVLTPEEEVRRRVVRHLVERLSIPATHIVEEYPVVLNGQSQRADIVVVDRDLRPFLVVECKAPEVPITQSVRDQVVRYNSILGAQQVVITNGVDIEAFRLSPEGGYSPIAFPL